MKRLVMSSILVAAMCAPALAEPLADPFESWNRSIFEFNERADRYVLKPVAQGYDAITPEPVQQGVRNFFNNLGEPVTVINALLQGKPEKAARSLTRFVFNSTIGLYGLFDVAGGMGLERDDEDF